MLKFTSKSFIAIITLVFLLMGLYSQAQLMTTSLTGIITDKEHHVMEGITVAIKELNKQTVTDETGSFIFTKLPAGKYVINISGNNVQPVNKEIEITGKKLALNIELDSKARELSAVTITAGGLRRKISDLPGSISVIDGRTIRESGAQSLTQIITRIPGVVAIDEDGRGLKPNFGLRGLDPNRNRSALILIDGKIPNGTMYYGDPGGYYMTPLQQIEKVEVIRGGAAVLYGGYSVGGIINLISKKAAAIPTTQFNLNYGSWNSWTAQLNTSGNNGKFGYMINGVRRQGDGFRERNRFGINDLTIKLDNYIDTTTKLSFYLNGFSENSETPGGLTQAQYDQNIQLSQHPYDHFVSDRYTATVSLDKKVGKHQQINAAVYGNYFKRNWYISRKKSVASSNFDTTTGYIRDIHLIGIVADYQNNNTLGNLENSFIAGIRLHTDRLNDLIMTAGEGNQELGKVNNFAISTSLIQELYAYNTISILPRLSFSLGGRFTAVDYKKQDFTNKNTATNTIGIKFKSGADAFVYAMGIVYKFNEENNIFINVSKGFQPPAIYWALDANTITYAGELKPENSMNYELGVRTQPARWLSTNITGYQIDYKNKLAQVLTPDNLYRIWQNIGTSMHRGIEMELELYPVKHISIYGSGAYQRAKQTSGTYKGNDLIYAPKLIFTTGIRYGNHIGKGQFATNAWLSYTGKQYADMANTETATTNGQNGPIPAYELANISFQYNQKRWSLNFVLNNLLNKKYFTKREGAFWNGILPMPGINYSAGISVKI